MSAPSPYRTPSEPEEKPETVEMSREFIMQKIRPRHVSGGFMGAPHPPFWDWSVQGAALFVGFEIADSIRELAAAIRGHK